MSDTAGKFCDTIHEKLESLEGRMDSLKSNVGSNWHSLQVKLGEVRHKGEATKQSVVDARAQLAQWFEEKKAETKDEINGWVETREVQKLAARAQRAEDCAAIAIEIAEASIDDAERMVLEAVATRRDAEAVTIAVADPKAVASRS